MTDVYLKADTVATTRFGLSAHLDNLCAIRQTIIGKNIKSKKRNIE